VAFVASGSCEECNRIDVQALTDVFEHLKADVGFRVLDPVQVSSVHRGCEMFLG